MLKQTYSIAFIWFSTIVTIYWIFHNTFIYFDFLILAIETLIPAVLVGVSLTFILRCKFSLWLKIIACVLIAEIAWILGWYVGVEIVNFLTGFATGFEQKVLLQNSQVTLKVYVLFNLNMPLIFVAFHLGANYLMVKFRRDG